jgi:hypothetical protein
VVFATAEGLKHARRVAQDCITQKRHEGACGWFIQQSSYFLLGQFVGGMVEEYLGVLNKLIGGCAEFRGDGGEAIHVDSIAIEQRRRLEYGVRWLSKHAMIRIERAGHFLRASDYMPVKLGHVIAETIQQCDNIE